MATQFYHTLPLQSIDLDILVQVVDRARNATTDPRWLNAINEAYDFLLNPHVDTISIAQDGTALIPSATCDTVYSANGVCQCSAFAYGKAPCWHRAAARLITRYTEALEAEADRLMHAVEAHEQRGDWQAYDAASARWTHIETLLSEVQR
jgi:hypothetical protein